MPPSHSSTTSGLPWLLWLDSFNRLQLCLQYNYYQTTIFTCHLCWIHNFLSDRPQAERLGSTAFTTIIVNTDCVLSPFLYTLYSNDCLSPSPFTKYFKYSDDTAILTLLTSYSISAICCQLHPMLYRQSPPPQCHQNKGTHPGHMPLTLHLSLPHLHQWPATRNC